MEDILASIRRILNDDEPPAVESAAASRPVAAAQIEHTAAPADDVDTDVFMLDESMLVPETPPPPPAAASPAPAAAIKPPVPSAPAAAASPPTPAPEPPPAPQEANPAQMTPALTTPASTTPASMSPDDFQPASQPAAAQDEPLTAPSAAAAASASMGALVRVVGQQQTPVYRGGPTLEDMVRDEIRPLVKSWLDEHLPPMVERMVRAEIARISEGK